MNKAVIYTSVIAIAIAAALLIRGQTEPTPATSEPIVTPVVSSPQQPQPAANIEATVPHQKAPAQSAKMTAAAKAQETQSTTEKSQVDQELDQKLGDALAAFNSEMADISRDDVEEQREQITALKEKALKSQPAEPREEIVTDKFGNPMKKLIYDSGEIRYVFL